MEIPSRPSKRIVFFLAVFFTVATLCPFAGGDTLQVAVTPELTSGQAMDAMQCGASACQSAQIATARQDAFRAIHDVLAHSVAVAAFGSAVLPEPQQIRAEVVRDPADLQSLQRIPLYLLHVSLIR